MKKLLPYLLVICVLSSLAFAFSVAWRRIDTTTVAKDHPYVVGSNGEFSVDSVNSITHMAGQIDSLFTLIPGSGGSSYNPGFADSRLNISANAVGSEFGWSAGGSGTGVVSNSIDSLGPYYLINGTNGNWYHARPTLSPIKPWLCDSVVYDVTCRLVAGKGAVGISAPDNINSSTRNLLSLDTVTTGVFIVWDVGFPSTSDVIFRSPTFSDTVTVNSLAFTIAVRAKFHAGFGSDSTVVYLNGVKRATFPPLYNRRPLMPFIATKFSGSVISAYWCNLFMPCDFTKTVPGS